MEYLGPLSVAQLFASEKEVGSFLRSLIEDVAIHADKHGGEDYIPPVVLYKGEYANTLNVDYNFLIQGLVELTGEKVIAMDYLPANMNGKDWMRNAMYLVVGILEKYYGLVKINSNKLDVSKYRNAGKIEIKSNFFHPIVVQRGGNIRKFMAVPVAVSELAKIVSDEEVEALIAIDGVDACEQLAFGAKGYYEYLQRNVEPTPVF